MKRKSKKKDKFNGLKLTLMRHLGVDIPKDQGDTWCGGELTPEQIAYSIDDVRYLVPLAEKELVEIREQGLEATLLLETMLLPIVVDMECRGIAINRVDLEKQLGPAREAATQSEMEVRRLLGDGCPKLGYHEGIKKWFLDKLGVKLENCQEPTLMECPHPAARALAKYTKTKKVADDMETWLERSARDGKLHTTFKPLGAETGRFSSEEPNLQNVPRGARSCFVPSDLSRILVDCDYSQIEMRIIAAVSGDATMIEEFRNGEDIYLKVASQVLVKPQDQVTKDVRKVIKAVVLGTMYGSGIGKLVEQIQDNLHVKVSEDEAYRIQRGFFSRYPAVSRWYHGAKSGQESITEARTLIGRRKLIPTEVNGWRRFVSKTNYIIQGTAADCLKLAMLELAPLLTPFNAWMVLTVHDELVIDCPREHAAEVERLTVDTMVGAASRILGGVVPIEVESKICENWGEK
jgi:DNA polymerase-1